MAGPKMRKNADYLTGINFETAPGVKVSNDKALFANRVGGSFGEPPMEDTGRHGAVAAQLRRVIQEPGMRKPELNRITAALRNLTPMQRRVVAAELALLDKQPATTLIIEGRFATTAACPHCQAKDAIRYGHANGCLLYTSPSPRDRTRSRMPSSA